MTPLEFSAVFALGVAGSLHCLGMCGPIVLSYSVGVRGPTIAAHAAYNAGRILTYMLLGTFAGAAGRGIGLLGQLAGLASGARIFGGAAMILAGILMLGAPSRMPPFAGRLLARLSRPFLTETRIRGKFLLGLTMGFLPCGLIYAALLKALESGGAISGALTMMAFGLGTAGALFASGIVSSFAGARFGRWSNRVAVASIMVFGAILLWRGIWGKPVCHG